ncbi:MAG TPA: hypothetical protein VNS32_07705 [Flavisolibacter sp.]|nr:hypothetical protein [Flavisolibacter sp.]
MKKITTLLLGCFAAFNSLYSQSSVTTISYNKTSQSALSLELPYNQDISEGFIISNLKKTGYDPETKGTFLWKQNKTNGFYVFKGVMLEGQKQGLDLYFRIEPKSKIEKEHSIIYLLVSKGNDSFLSSDDASYKAAIKFMNGFIDQSAAYKLELDVKAQENVVKEAEQKLLDMQQDETSLNKKMEQLKTELNKNKTEQEAQQRAVENEKKKLAMLKAKA